MLLLLAQIGMVNAGKGGCIFCSERGSGEHLKTNEGIKNQIENFLNSYRGKRANKFIVYYQNYSNTYDSIENLKKKYDEAFFDSRIIGISIATRPDCIDENICKLLLGYAKKYYVSVELGLQTSSDEIAKVINRGYNSDIFTKAVNMLNKYNIDVVAHIIIGLPNETKDDIINTVNFLNYHNIQGLKIHSCYVVKNTKLEEMYLKNEYRPITLEYYLESLCYIISHIKENIIIHRISGDAPKDILVVPSWNTHKKWVINGIEKKLKEKDLWQSKYYHI